MKRLAITFSLIACAAPGLASASALSLAKSSSTSAAGLPGIQVETSLSRPGSGSNPTRDTINEGLPGLATVSYTAQNFGTGHAASDALRVNLGSTPPSLGADLDTVVFSPLVLNPNVTAILPGIGSAGPQHIYTLFDDTLLGALAIGTQNNGTGRVFTLTASYFSPTL
jgi:hypothetical protein